MGTMYFSSNNNIESGNIKAELQSNNNVDNASIKTKLQSESSKKRKCKCGLTQLLLSGSILITLGLLSIKYTFFDIILSMRLQFQPGFPPHDLWLNPKPELRLNVYIFTVDNANEFLNGNDSKIKIREIGPIVYREYLQHKDVVFHENSTMSYTAFRWAEFVPHANEEGILNKTITVPNLSVLAAAGYVNELSYFLQWGFNTFLGPPTEGVFINISIYDYLWNYTSPLLEKAKKFQPSLVPTLNSGILHGVYVDNNDHYNVRIGPKYGDSEFFLINTVNGVPTVPGYDVQNGDCYASLENSTEGAMYRQHITRETELWFWRKALCRTVVLRYEKDVQVGKIAAYKYTLGTDMYDRLPNKTSDCYGGVDVELQNGLTDVSKCYFNMPFAASQPHFRGRSEGFTKKFEGLHESEEKHTSFTIVEPKMGIPMVQAARSQMNLVIPKLGFMFHKEYQLFSDMILPLFWVEYAQNDLTPDIIDMVDFFINVLPIIQHILSCSLLLIGLVLIIIAFPKLISSRWYLVNISSKSKDSAAKIENKLQNNSKVEKNVGVTQA